VKVNGVTVSDFQVHQSPVGVRGNGKRE